MSVRAGDRTQGKLEVLNLAMNLCTHTLRLCKNEKYFPKSQRWLFTSKLANEAVSAMTNIRKANATLLDGDEDHYKLRKTYQAEAHANLGALYALIDVAFNMGTGLDSGQVEYWTGLVRDTDEKLKAWIRSDKKTYLDKHGE